LFLIVARLRTRHVQCDFWTINILCISVHEQSVCQKGVENANTRTVHKFLKNFTNNIKVTQQNLFQNSSFRMKRGSTTSILNQNNKACNGTNEISQNCHFITLHDSVFFHAICKQPTTAKMHKTFITKMSYCACRVLSHATTRSNCYFNFILNKTRSGLELVLKMQLRKWHHLSCCSRLSPSLTVLTNASIVASRCWPNCVIIDSQSPIVSAISELFSSCFNSSNHRFN